MLTKSLDWKYEGERRCIFSINEKDSRISDGKITENEIEKDAKFFEMNPPKTIYIGCNATPEFETEMRKLSKGVPIKKMKRKDGRYGLVAE